MDSEIYNTGVPAGLLVFIVTQNSDRLAAFEHTIQGLGARSLGPQSFWFGEGESSLEAIRAALGALMDQDCVYVTDAVDGKLRSHLIVAPRTEGGIRIG